MAGSAARAPARRLDLERACAWLGSKDLELPAGRIDEDILPFGAGSQGRIQW
jgi:hypothetical protein